MLDVEHLVKEHIFHGALRDAGMIQATIEQNLIRPRIVTAELSPPSANAPADVRPWQFGSEISRVKLVEKFFQIEVLAARPGVTRANALKPHAVHAAARAAGSRVIEIRLDERSGRLAAVHARKQERGGRFQHGQRRTPQQVREAHVDDIFAAANRERQTGIPIKRDAEAWWAAIAA